MGAVATWNVVRYLCFLGARSLLGMRTVIRRDSAPEESYSQSGVVEIEVVPEFLLRDHQRGKDLPLRISFPASGGPYPVIVFSHGAGGSKDDYGPLSRFWAGQGYVCIHPTHADSIPDQKREKGGWGGVLGDLRAIINLVLSDPREWENRTRDIRLLLDSLETVSHQVPGLSGKVDASVVGISGHSYGALIVQLLGGTTVQVGSERISHADPRPAAALLFSPQGRGQFGLTDESWEDMRLPTMTITGSLDRGTRGQRVEWILDTFNLSPPGDKYLVLMEGASHLSFSTRKMQEMESLRQPVDASAGNEQWAIYNQMKQASIAFWDAYLKKTPAAVSYLKSQRLAGGSGKPVSLLRK